MRRKRRYDVVMLWEWMTLVVLAQERACLIHSPEVELMARKMLIRLLGYIQPED